MNPVDQLDRLVKRFEIAGAVLAAQDADVDDVFRVAAPAAHVLRDAAHDLGRELPQEILDYLKHCAALRCGWQLPDEAADTLPAATNEVFWGRIDLSVKEVVAAETSRQGWVKECFPNRDDAYDVIWHDKFAFLTVPNGDCIAIGDDPGDRAVYYLSHDDGGGHGVILAPSLPEFLERWSLLAFVGPEDWLMLPFLGADDGAGLDPNCANAVEWRAALQLPALDAAEHGAAD